jgi:Flp pilus assembly protein TadG
MFRLSYFRGKTGRRATVAVLVALSITMLLGMVAVSVDGGLLQDNKRRVQNAADAAALAAGNMLFVNYPKISSITNADPNGAAVAAAKQSASDNGFGHNGTDKFVVVNVPPKNGPFKDIVGYAEVIITYKQPRYFSTVWGSTATPVVARAVGKGFWGSTGNGVIVLDPVQKAALDSSGTGSVTVTGGAAMVVNSDHTEAAARATGGGTLTAAQFRVVGAASGTFNGTVTTGVLPTPDPLAYLPVPEKPAAGDMKKTNTGPGSKTYYLTPGSYNNLPNFGNGDTVILQQGGIYYISGGLTTTNGASIIMDTATTGGVMIYNAPNGSQTNQAINLSGGIVNLSPLTSGPYAGIVMWQDRASDVPMSIQGQGGMTIKGTFYAANAQLQVSGQGSNTIGSQYISRTLSLSGGGNVLIDYNNDDTARTREVRLAE